MFLIKTQAVAENNDHERGSWRKTRKLGEARIEVSAKSFQEVKEILRHHYKEYKDAVDTSKYLPNGFCHLMEFVKEDWKWNSCLMCSEDLKYIVEITEAKELV